MARVKICGLTRLEDIDAVNAARADYAGFVLAPSRRRVDPARLERLRAALLPGIRAVGVFVDALLDFVSALCRQGLIDIVQLHGNEDVRYMLELRARTGAPVIKALRVSDARTLLHADASPCDYLLLDAYSPAQAGGTGQTFDWSLIPPLEKPYFLAGGLDEKNAPLAIERLDPFALDVSSGVETDGIKDFEKIRRFVLSARGEIRYE